MRVFTAWLAVLFVFSACAKPWPDRTPLEVEPLAASQQEMRATDHIVVITDGSATMTQEANFPEARALAQSLIAAMPEADERTYRAGLINFGGDARDTAPLADFDRAALSDKAAWISPLGVPGNATTPLDAVLGEVQDELAGSQGRAAIVILSDGLPNSEEQSLEAARSLIASHNGDVCIHTVHTGMDQAGQAFLKELSELTRCGSTRSGASLSTASDMQGFERDIFMVAAGTAPAVGAIGPCSRKLVLRGINFGFDQAQITPETSTILNAAADHLMRCGDVSIQVDGFTCSIGTPQYNESLSERRASAVRSYLIDAGVSSSRLTTKGYGESDPVASNQSADGRSQNRRVELSPR